MKHIEELVAIFLALILLFLNKIKAKALLKIK